MACTALVKSAPAILVTIVLCGALIGCVYPGPYGAYPAVYPVYGGSRPVVVAGG